MKLVDLVLYTQTEDENNGCHLFKLENLVSLLPTQLDVSGHGGPLVSPVPSGLKLTRGAEAVVSSMAP